MQCSDDTFVERADCEASIALGKIAKSGHPEPGHFIVIYGSSRFGKSSLVSRHLESRDPIVIDCAFHETEGGGETIIESAARKLNLAVASTDVAARTATSRRLSGNEMGIKTPVTTTRKEEKERATQETKTVEERREHTIAEEVSDALHHQERILILEDAHKLHPSSLESLSSKLKGAIHKGVIIIFVFADWGNELSPKHSDSLTRHWSKKVSAWSDLDLSAIGHAGFEALSLEVNQSLVDDLARNAVACPAIMQALCKKVCDLSKIDGSPTGGKFDLEHFPDRAFQEVAQQIGHGFESQFHRSKVGLSSPEALARVTAKLAGGDFQPRGQESNAPPIAFTIRSKRLYAQQYALACLESIVKSQYSDSSIQTSGSTSSISAPVVTVSMQNIRSQHSAFASQQPGAMPETLSRNAERQIEAAILWMSTVRFAGSHQVIEFDNSKELAYISDPDFIFYLLRSNFTERLVSGAV